MPEDLAAFVVAYSVLWLGLGAYLVRLHRLAERIATRVAELDARRGG